MKGERATKLEHPAFLRRLLTRFGEVFEQLKGLPPPRVHEHAIILKEGGDPVGFRPYRYPQIKKEEIRAVNW